MGAETIFVVSSMVLLTIVTLGVARYRLGVSITACIATVLPTIVLSSLLVAWLQAALSLHLFALPAGAGVVVLVLAGITVATG